MTKRQSNKRVILLGPQRHQPNLASAIDSLGLPADARVAAVTAGWEEREPEDLELGEHLGGRVVNLRVFQRGDEVYRKDPELHKAMQERHDTQWQLQELYRLRLSHALEAVRELMGHSGDVKLLEPIQAAAIEAVREIDRLHFTQVAEIHAEFCERWRPAERDSVRHHREEMKQTLGDTAALCVAGGHVGILLNRIRLFELMELAEDRPVIGWSAGAMVLTERVVLFHDTPPQGPGNAEVFGPALGICTGVVPLPHAKHRLRLDDPTRVAILARRFHPDLCAALDEGSSIAWDGERWQASGATRQLIENGTLTAAEVA